MPGFTYDRLTFRELTLDDLGSLKVGDRYLFDFDQVEKAKRSQIELTDDDFFACLRALKIYINNQEYPELARIVTLIHLTNGDTSLIRAACSYTSDSTLNKFTGQLMNLWHYIVGELIEVKVAAVFGTEPTSRASQKTAQFIRLNRTAKSMLNRIKTKTRAEVLEDEFSIAKSLLGLDLFYHIKDKTCLTELSIEEILRIKEVVRISENDIEVLETLYSIASLYIKYFPIKKITEASRSHRSIYSVMVWLRTECMALIGPEEDEFDADAEQ